MSTASFPVPEPALNAHETASAAWAVLSGIGWVLGLPVWYLGVSILWVLRVVFWPVVFLLQPVFYLAQFIGTCLFFPVRLLVQFETLYIFLSIAALVGLSIGLISRSIFSGLRTLLQLDLPLTLEPTKPSTSNGRTLREWREAKRQQHEQQHEQQQQRISQARAAISSSSGSMSMTPSSSPTATRGYASTHTPGALGAMGYVSVGGGSSSSGSGGGRGNADRGQGKGGKRNGRGVANALSPTMTTVPSPQRGLLEQTILEEEDSDFDY